jgi:hypothetical protein
MYFTIVEVEKGKKVKIYTTTVCGENVAEVCSFLRDFGWDVNPDPEEPDCGVGYSADMNPVCVDPIDDPTPLYREYFTKDRLLDE